MQECMVVYHKYSERRAADSGQITAYFEDTAHIITNISINSVSLLPQDKKNWDKKEDCRVNSYEENKVNKRRGPTQDIPFSTPDLI